MSNNRPIMDNYADLTKKEHADNRHVNVPPQQQQQRVPLVQKQAPQECSNPLEKHELLVDDASGQRDKGMVKPSAQVHIAKKPAPCADCSSSSSSNPVSDVAPSFPSQKASTMVMIMAQPIVSDDKMFESPLNDKQMTLVLCPAPPPRLSRSGISQLDLSASHSCGGRTQISPQEVPPRRSRLHIASEGSLMATAGSRSSSSSMEERDRDRDMHTETSSQASEKSTAREHGQVAAHTKPGSDAESIFRSSPPPYDTLGSRGAPVPGQRHVIAGLHEVSLHSVTVNSTSSAEMPWEVKMSGNPGSSDGGRISPVTAVFPGAMQHPGVYVCVRIHTCVAYICAVAWHTFCGCLFVWQTEFMDKDIVSVSLSAAQPDCLHWMHVCVCACVCVCVFMPCVFTCTSYSCKLRAYIHSRVYACASSCTYI
jgi:hypothetical protein